MMMMTTTIMPTLIVFMLNCVPCRCSNSFSFLFLFLFCRCSLSFSFPLSFSFLQVFSLLNSIAFAFAAYTVAFQVNTVSSADQARSVVESNHNIWFSNTPNLYILDFSFCACIESLLCKRRDDQYWCLSLWSLIKASCLFEFSAFVHAFCGWQLVLTQKKGNVLEK